MKYNILIIGYGSIGRKYYSLLNKEKKNYKLYVLSRIFDVRKNFISLRYKIKNLNPDLIIISSKTSDHIKDLKLVNKYFRNKKILIEKPIFSKVEKITNLKNKIYVGYNLRFHPLLQKLLYLIKNRKIYSININCSSYLPKWRTNLHYTLSSSSQDKYGGGVLKDLSHEIDYLHLLRKKIGISSYKFKKISDLKIKTNDYFYLNAYSGKTMIDLTLKYHSLREFRYISIDCKNFNFYLDFLKNELSIKSLKKLKTIKLKKFKINDTYMKQVKSILNNEKIACSFNEGLKVLKFIEKFK